MFIYPCLKTETVEEDIDQGLADWANNLPSFRVRDEYVLKMLEDTVTSLGNQTSDMAIACIFSFCIHVTGRKKQSSYSLPLSH